MSMDWMPTLMDIVGAKKNELLDGVSLWPGIQGKDDSNNQDRTLLWVRREGGTRYGGQDYYAIRKGSWKLLQNRSTEDFQLFNLEKDPIESNPVKGSPKIRRELENYLREHVRKAGFIPWQGRIPDLEKVDYGQK